MSVTNVSTPCLVSCTSLGPALDMQLTDPTGNQLSTFCSSTSFADNVVTTCENCYTLTSQQSFFANCTVSDSYRKPNNPVADFISFQSWKLSAITAIFRLPVVLLSPSQPLASSTLHSYQPQLFPMHPQPHRQDHQLSSNT